MNRIESKTVKYNGTMKKYNEYRISTDKAKEMVQYANSLEPEFCKIHARHIGLNRVKITEVSGNCVDTLEGIMDQFPGSQFILE